MIWVFPDARLGYAYLDMVDQPEIPEAPLGNRKADFTPYPKNPITARFFKEIGLADELGSGVRNLY